MSVDTIYLRQLFSLTQAALREKIGVNLADIRQRQEELIVKAEKFNKGIIPENEAADFARETGEKALECEIRAGEELQKIQEEREKPVQYSPEVEKFLSGLSEGKRNLIQSEHDIARQLPISDMENLIAELKRLREMAWYLTAHIQDYAETPEYHERRRAFFPRGETTLETIPDSQSSEADSEIPGFVLSIAGYYPKFIKHYPELVKAEYIKPKDTGLQWLKSKQSLAEYFSAIKPEGKRNNWTVLENVFDVKDLRNAASQNGNPFKNKKSMDFEALQGIITIKPRDCG